MIRPFVRVSSVAAIVVFAALAATAAEPLQYELRFKRPNTHLMDIVIHVTGLEGTAAEFAMKSSPP